MTPTKRIGSDDGLVRAIELVLTPVAFAGIGWVLDRVFGTSPVLLIVLPTVAFVGKVLAEWFKYDHKMKGLEAELLGDRPTHTRRLDHLADSTDTGGALPEGVTLDSNSERTA